MKIQLVDQVINISQWPEDQNYAGVFPKGARIKSAYFCPDPSPYPFLIPKHRYLFKQSSHNYPEQYWVEIFAYRFGSLIEVCVPPTFVAHKDNETFGALIEWFYDTNDKSFLDYVDGGNIMRAAIPNFDSKKGKEHNFTTLNDKILGGSEKENCDFWAKVFTFDALIGNTDRHQDNWGIIFYKNLKDPQQVKGFFAPAFDNGTSMGHEILAEHFYKYDNPKKLEKYILKGVHHMKWDRNDTKRTQHAEFIVKFVKLYPQTKKTILNCLSFKKESVEQILQTLTQVQVKLPLSQARASFMLKLILERQKILQERISATI